MQNIEQYCKQIADVKKQVQKVVFGKDEVIDKIMMAIIGSGHVLIDESQYACILHSFPMHLEIMSQFHWESAQEEALRFREWQRLVHL